MTIKIDDTGIHLIGDFLRPEFTRCDPMFPPSLPTLLEACADFRGEEKFLKDTIQEYKMGVAMLSIMSKEELLSKCTLAVERDLPKLRFLEKLYRKSNPSEVEALSAFVKQAEKQLAAYKRGELGSKTHQRGSKRK